MLTGEFKALMSHIGVPVYRIIALLTLMALTAVLGCSGGAPVKEPSDLDTAAGGTRPTPVSGPVSLRFKWHDAKVLTYRVTTGEVDPMHHTVTGRRSTYRLSLTPTRDSDTILIECERTAAEGLMDGDVIPVEEEQESGSKAEVNSHGRVLRLLEVKGDEIPTGGFLEESDKEIYALMVIGFPYAELALGVVHACPLPSDPVRAGDTWSTTVGIPSTKGPGEGKAVRYEGKLVRLEEAAGHVYAIIESRVFPPDMDEPFVALARFDITAGRITFARWTAIPGARERHPTRWIELMH